MQNGMASKSERFPSKPITVIVPSGVGSSYDMIARALEKVASRQFGQPLVVVNKPGGTGTIGWNELASAPPDGYTIGITGVSLILQPLYSSTKYDYQTALEPLAQIASTPLVMTVQANQPWANVKELIIYGKHHPGQLKFSHQGVGSVGHVVGERFAQIAGIEFEQVPFIGGNEATVALLGGHVQVAIVTPATIKEQIKNGTLIALAATGERRMTDPLFANVPTFTELGFDISTNIWFGLAVPKEVPTEIKTRLANGFKDIIMEPEFKSNIESMGLEYDYLGPRETEQKWLADSKKLADFIQTTGVLDLIKAQKN